MNDVVVTAGEINRDPRLQDVDVSAFLSSRTVTVVDEADKPIEKARVAATEEGSNRFTTVETGADGRAVVTSRGKTVEVVVAREGYRAVKLVRVTGDVRATLEKSAPKPVTSAWTTRSRRLPKSRRSRSPSSGSADPTSGRPRRPRGATQERTPTGHVRRGSHRARPDPEPGHLRSPTRVELGRIDSGGGVFGAEGCQGDPDRARGRRDPDRDRHS